MKSLWPNISAWQNHLGWLYHPYRSYRENGNQRKGSLEDAIITQETRSAPTQDSPVDVRAREVEEQMTDDEWFSLYRFSPKH